MEIIWQTNLEYSDYDTTKLRLVIKNGDLRLEYYNGEIKWNSNTELINSNLGPYELRLNDDGYLTVFDAFNNLVWTNKYLNNG